MRRHAQVDGDRTGPRSGAVRAKGGPGESLLFLQRAVGNRAVLSLLTNRGRGDPVVQRRGVLGVVAVGGNIDWVAIIREIREEYQYDAALAGGLEGWYNQLRNKPNVQPGQVNRRLILPLNRALAMHAQPQPHADVVANSPAMDAAPRDHQTLVPLLIAKWDWNEETLTQKADQIFNLNNNDVAQAGVGQDTIRGTSNKQGWRYRIDREGPAQGGTAAQFRLQFGTATYAGLHVDLNQNFGARFLRDAWTQSYNAGQTVHVHMV